MKHPQPLTPALKQEIATLQAKGKTNYEIAQATGLDRRQLANVIRHMKGSQKASEPSVTIESREHFSWGRDGRWIQPHTTITNKTA